ncbi:hypothetical protein E3P89_00547 [Wallemia ichthyophaga]|uniref:Uncharacterized protein n=1 Tax=Wallemia ichthyophaga TaxID=245174 RepID=A0A4T0F805_WALIC|nr:hypothetical protein E3P98_00559 [Wallemia ichthyophaga]TIB15744.1 hypothetical protein E3P90_00706 [Wallemia ichthyophaga]TIB17723.1 hypothetical protein E3P93_00563 [Wallemia ichthyophaga]TIB25247.1 hypothetical protein E3P89_00547 [Wallemia ichthyophaga]TIB26939.1 hypothetical protein E3P88_00575 [Wallemia ichthyophaga]
MGSNQSTPQDFHSETTPTTPIRFSTSLVNDLSDDQKTESQTQSQTPSQITLDDQIRNRINSELSRLRSEEHSIRQQIENSLAQDNAAKSKQPDNSILSSENVKRNIDDIKTKIDKHHQKRDINNFPEVKNSHSSLISCFKDNSQTPLNCHIQVDQFKQAVSQAEKIFIHSLQTA